MYIGERIEDIKMIEIVFNSNARGALQVAQTFGRGSWLFKGKPSMMFYGNPDEQAMKELKEAL